MTTFLCGRFRKGVAKVRTPSGQIVVFTDGRAEVDDPELCAALLDVPAVFRVALAEGETLPESPPPDDSAPAMPEGMSVSGTLDWVREDKEDVEQIAERAALALVVEQAAGEYARATLVDRLEKILAAIE